MGSFHLKSPRCRRRDLRENDRLLGMADRFERRFKCIGHRRRPAEKDHGVRAGRRQMPAQDALGDTAHPLRPADRRLVQHMMAVEARMFAHILVPLLPENNVGRGLIGPRGAGHRRRRIRPFHRRSSHGRRGGRRATDPTWHRQAGQNTTSVCRGYRDESRSARRAQASST